jgi:hypothetical protein
VVDTVGAWCVGSGVSTTLQFGGKGQDISTSNPKYYDTASGYTQFYAIDNEGVYAAETSPYQLTHRSNATDLPIIKIFTCPFTLLTSTSSLMWGCSSSSGYVYFGVVRASDGSGCIVKFDKFTGVYIDTFVDNGILAFQVTRDDTIIYNKGTNLYMSTDFGLSSELFCSIGAKYSSSSRGQVIWTCFKLSTNLIVISTNGAHTLNIGLFTNQSTFTQGTQTVKEVAEDIISKTALPPSKVNFAALSGDTLRGYTSRTSTNAANMIEPLITGYNFDLVEENGTLIAKKRGTSISSRSINSNDLGATIDG